MFEFMFSIDSGMTCLGNASEVGQCVTPQNKVQTSISERGCIDQGVPDRKLL